MLKPKEKKYLFWIGNKVEEPKNKNYCKYRWAKLDQSDDEFVAEYNVITEIYYVPGDEQEYCEDDFKWLGDWIEK